MKLSPLHTKWLVPDSFLWRLHMGIICQQLFHRFDFPAKAACLPVPPATPWFVTKPPFPPSLAYNSLVVVHVWYAPHHGHTSFWDADFTFWRELHDALTINFAENSARGSCSSDVKRSSSRVDFNIIDESANWEGAEWVGITFFGSDCNAQKTFCSSCYLYFSILLSKLTHNKRVIAAQLKSLPGVLDSTLLDFTRSPAFIFSVATI